MASSEVNPALVAAIVNQVLSALQRMNIDGSSAAVDSSELSQMFIYRILTIPTLNIDANTNGHGSDADDDGYVVQFSSGPPSPAPTSVPDMATTSATTMLPGTTVAEPAANAALPAAIPSSTPDTQAASAAVPPLNTAPAATAPPVAHNVTQAHGSWYMISTGLAVGVFRGW